MADAVGGDMAGGVDRTDGLLQSLISRQPSDGFPQRRK
jgi:hypothetical protein